MLCVVSMLIQNGSDLGKTWIGKLYIYWTVIILTSLYTRHNLHIFISVDKMKKQICYTIFVKHIYSSEEGKELKVIFNPSESRMWINSTEKEAKWRCHCTVYKWYYTQGNGVATGCCFVLPNVLGTETILSAQYRWWYVHCSLRTYHIVFLWRLTLLLFRSVINCVFILLFLIIFRSFEYCIVLLRGNTTLACLSYLSNIA